jgi:hypothetical protein
MMEDEAIMIAPQAGSGIGRNDGAHPQLDKKPFGSNWRILSPSSSI